MRTLIFIVCLVTQGAFAQENPDLYKNEVIGFEISKPSGWSFESKEKILRIKADPKLTDKRLAEEVKRYATTPIAVITKHNPPTLDNPTVAVVYKPIAPLKGWEPSKVLEIYANDAVAKIPNVQVLVPPENRPVNGVPGGYMKIKYPPNMGADIKASITGETIMIPQGDYMYLINLYSINEEPMFQQIVESIKVRVGDESS